MDKLNKYLREKLFNCKGKEAVISSVLFILKKGESSNGGGGGNRTHVQYRLRSAFTGLVPFCGLRNEAARNSHFRPELLNFPSYSGARAEGKPV